MFNVLLILYGIIIILCMISVLKLNLKSYFFNPSYEKTMNFYIEIIILLLKLLMLTFVECLPFKTEFDTAPSFASLFFKKYFSSQAWLAKALRQSPQRKQNHMSWWPAWAKWRDPVSKQTAFFLYSLISCNTNFLKRDHSSILC